MRYEFTLSQKQEMAERSQGVCEAGEFGTRELYAMPSCADMCLKPAAHFDHIVPTELAQRKPTVDEGLHVCLAHHKLKTKMQDMPRIAKARRIRDKARGVTRAKKPWPSRKFNAGWADNTKYINCEADPDT